MKIGIDKFAHFGVGALICAVVTMVLFMQDTTFVISWNNLLWTVAGTIVAMMCQLVKEYIIDDKADHKDTLATFIGCVVIIVAFTVGILLNHMSH